MNHDEANAAYASVGEYIRALREESEHRRVWGVKLMRENGELLDEITLLREEIAQLKGENAILLKALP